MIFNQKSDNGQLSFCNSAKFTDGWIFNEMSLSS